MGRLNEQVAIVGTGMSMYDTDVDKDERSKIVEATLNAAADTKKQSLSEIDIQAVFYGCYVAGNETDGVSPPSATNFELGLSPKPGYRVETACASGASAIQVAAMSVASGQYDTVLVVGYDYHNAESRRSAYDAARTGDTRYEVFFGAPAFGYAADMANLYLKKYPHYKEEDFALIAVRGHEYAEDNPYASAKKVSLEAVMNSPYIVRPIKLFEISQIVNGASAAILCRADIAKQYTDAPVYFVSGGVGSGIPFAGRITQYEMLESCLEASQKAFSVPGFSVHDMDYAEVFDQFTPLPIQATETMGLFKLGEALMAVREGRTARGGDIPMNVGGGTQGLGHAPGGAGVAQVWEICRQLKNTAGERCQVKNASKAFQAAIGGTNFIYTTINVYSNEL